MYHSLVRKKIQKIFQQLSEGNFEPSLKSISSDFEHQFSGDHCLGGQRHTSDGMRRWFKRLFFLFPQLKFEVKEILVKGWTWNTVVSVEWIDRGKTQDGQPYSNQGVHFLHLRWGKLVSIHAYLDSQRLERECLRMAKLGIKEAAALPIED